MRLFLGTVALAAMTALSAFAAPPQPSAAPACRGTDRLLNLTTLEMAQHDGSYGKTRIEVLASSDLSHPIKTYDIEGEWICLGYNKAEHRFVLGGLFEEGAWQLLQRISYLDERTSDLIDSRLGDLGIFTARISQDGDYLAFVGRKNKTDYFEKLMVLEFASGRIKTLGPGPAPDPVAADQRIFCTSDIPLRYHLCPGTKDDFTCSKHFPVRWWWGDNGFTDGYREISPVVLDFVGKSQLRVSLGDDRCEARTKRRKVVTYELRVSFPPVKK